MTLRDLAIARADVRITALRAALARITWEPVTVSAAKRMRETAETALTNDDERMGL